MSGWAGEPAINDWCGDCGVCGDKSGKIQIEAQSRNANTRTRAYKC